MRPFLVRCSGCERHVFSDEERCPFCARTIARAAAPAVPPARMSRAAQLAWKLTLGSAGLAACRAPAATPTGASLVEVADDASVAAGPIADAGSPADARANEWRPVGMIPIYGSNRLVITQQVGFARGSDAIAKGQETLLDEVASIAKERKLRLYVDGRADASEPNVAKLSGARARRVAAALIQRITASVFTHRPTCASEKVLQPRPSAHFQGANPGSPRPQCVPCPLNSSLACSGKG